MVFYCLILVSGIRLMDVCLFSFHLEKIGLSYKEKKSSAEQFCRALTAFHIPLYNYPGFFLLTGLPSSAGPGS